MNYSLAFLAEVAHELRTSPADLNAATAIQRLAETGSNQLAETRCQSVVKRLLHQFTDGLMLVLLASR